jgi:hypothetical protein
LSSFSWADAPPANNRPVVNAKAATKCFISPPNVVPRFSLEPEYTGIMPGIPHLA